MWTSSASSAWAFTRAFMVASHVEVVSRAAGSDEANRWESDGTAGYTVTPCEKAENGTKITLTIKEKHGKARITTSSSSRTAWQGLVKKVFRLYPLPDQDGYDALAHEGEAGGRRAEDYKPEWEEYVENVTLNSMVPIWKKSKKELTDEDYNSFYTGKFYDYQPPLLHIHTSVEGAVTYTAMLFIPSHAPWDYYTKDFEKGPAALFHGVLIMDKCADLLPRPLQLCARHGGHGRPVAQHLPPRCSSTTATLKAIAQSLEKKNKNELLKLAKDKREDYEKFWQAFGRQLKSGARAISESHKELLQDLLMYHSSTEDKLVTLEEYVSRMKEEQKYIYYACGETVDKIKLLPAMETLRDKGYEVLCLDDNIDEFCIKMLANYKEKEFKSIADADLGLETEDEKEEIKKLSEENKGLLEALGKALDGKVKTVELTGRLKSHPCCLRAEGPMTLEMEKVLNQQALDDSQRVHAERVLELNADHPIFRKLCQLQQEGSDQLATYADILYTQALLIEGMPVEDPVAYANAVCSLIS